MRERTKEKENKEKAPAGESYPRGYYVHCFALLHYTAVVDLFNMVAGATKAARRGATDGVMGGFSAAFDIQLDEYLENEYLEHDFAHLGGVDGVKKDLAWIDLPLVQITYMDTPDSGDQFFIVVVRDAVLFNVIPFDIGVVAKVGRCLGRCKLDHRSGLESTTRFQSLIVVQRIQHSALSSC